MSLTLKSNSGKAAVIELEKEIEPSATKASDVTINLVLEAKAKAAIEVLVNKEVVAKVLPGEPTTASEVQVTISVAAGQKYEVKKAVGLKEALASVAPAQNQLAASDVENLLNEGKATAALAAWQANQELAEKNAKILSLTSK